MDEIVELAKQVRKSLDEFDEIKEYLKIKALFESSTELKDLRKEISEAKKENLSTFQELKNKYINHPLVINFYQAREEAFNILRIVKENIK